MIFSVQLYSFRDFMSLDEMLSFVKSKGLNYVEPAGLYDIGLEELLRRVKNSDLSCSSVHLGPEDIETNLEDIVQLLPQYGVLDLVYPYLDPQIIASNSDELDKLVNFLNDTSKLLSKNGIRLHFHNHAVELEQQYKDTLIIDHILESAEDVFWQIDVAWVVAASHNPLEWIKKWQDRIRIVHIKDVVKQGNEFLPADAGDGMVDFESILSLTRELGIDTFVLENDFPKDPQVFLDKGIKALQSLQ